MVVSTVVSLVLNMTPQERATLLAAADLYQCASDMFRGKLVVAQKSFGIIEGDDTGCYCHSDYWQQVRNKYDAFKVLQVAEQWYKDLYRLKLSKKRTINVFVESLPSDVFIFLPDLVFTFMDCINCNCAYGNAPPNETMVTLKQCFCHGCGKPKYDEFKFQVEEIPSKTPICECRDNAWDVHLPAINHMFCMRCHRELLMYEDVVFEDDEDKPEHYFKVL